MRESPPNFGSNKGRGISRAVKAREKKQKRRVNLFSIRWKARRGNKKIRETGKKRPVKTSIKLWKERMKGQKKRSSREELSSSVQVLYVLSSEWLFEDAICYSYSATIETIETIETKIKGPKKATEILFLVSETFSARSLVFSFPRFAVPRFGKFSTSQRDLSFSQWILVYLFYISHVSRRNSGACWPRWNIAIAGRSTVARARQNPRWTCRVVERKGVKTAEQPREWQGRKPGRKKQSRK